MYKKKPTTCEIWDYLWLQAATGGLGRISPMEEGGPLSMFIEVINLGGWWGAPPPSTPQQENTGLGVELVSKV